MDKYPEITFAVENKFKKLSKEKLTPWIFLNAGKMVQIEDFYERTIQYRGVSFEGSPREVFWGGFIEPFLEDIFVWAFEFALDYAKKRNSDRRELILYTRECLMNGLCLTYNKMQKIDRNLRGKGYPDQVSPRDISREIKKMQNKLDEYRDSTLNICEQSKGGNMTNDEALDIASDFQNYLRSGDKGLIEKYTKIQIKCALSLIPHSKGNHQWYKEMERRIEEIDEEVKNKKESTMVSTKFAFLSTEFIWGDIKNDYRETKRKFGKKINFVSDLFKREIIFRDIEHAYYLANIGFSKPAVILAGGVIEELLRLYLKSKSITPVKDDFNGYIKTCENRRLLKSAIHRLSDSVRQFRNLVHLKKETTSRHTISIATAKGAVASIFTIANDF